ncbi:MAG TPA: 16S rRNA (cytidine(1402)-2'-O)-methyltransferase [Chromatiales bacterium]|jgi:16S rRNA (cytidine1402-2'-O)-methyltransferase|nr:16S rRNA (cytidine(1402)-2'-O)-methyltransferase [Chromatiaceae bacterium]HIN82161.1 16S rRNA (cytidine(1402)-2'-O)-methyltransferase [Chromatiales bacterium]
MSVGSLYIVATPIGNLADITRRAVEVLESVAWIAAEDTRHSGRLLKALGITTRQFALHEHNEGRASERVLRYLAEGADIALITDAGTPLISDPGYAVVRAARAAGYPVLAVPGPSAVIAALSVSGLACDHFRFNGFLPRKAGERRTCLRQLAADSATLVFYESPHRIVDSLIDCVEVFGGTRQAVIARELTKTFETVQGGTLEELLVWIQADSDQQRGEFVLLITGAEPSQAVDIDIDQTLRLLLEELPASRAAALASRMSGLPRKDLYKRCLALSGE